MGRRGEFELIARHFAPLARGEAGALGLLDDAAVIAIEPGRRLAITTDTMVAGVHFLPETAPEDVAAKLLRVNLSDLAAMGAKPRGYTLNTAFPRSIDEAWIARFAAGLAEDQERFGIPLLGGDTVSTPGPLTLTVTALGTVAEGREMRRSGARPGDAVWVTGTIGDGFLGLMAARGELDFLCEEEILYLTGRLDRPTPRLDLGRKLAEEGLAHAAADVSDGLVADLGHVCEASGLAAEIDAGAVPLSLAARAVLKVRPDLLPAMLAGGDDYELVFAAPEGLAGIEARAIGRFKEGRPGVRVRAADGRDMSFATGGFQHF